jgi:hypothetical protein
MESEKKQQVSDTLQETATPIKVGLFKFLVKQPTLGQIYDMGAVAINIQDADLREKMESAQRVNVIAEAITHYNDARIMQQVFMILLFRRKLWRWVWKRYILHRLTVDKFNELVAIVGRSFNINFFLTSIIFLKQTTKITEPKQTTAHGQQSEA